MIRVLIVDDHPVVRAGLQALIGAQPDLDVVGDALDGETALEMVRVDPPDVVVMDLSMLGMGGIAATSAIRAEHPQVHVLILTWLADPGRVREALAAGATGYLLKDADHAALLDGIRAAHRGESRISSTLVKAITA